MQDGGEEGELAEQVVLDKFKLARANMKSYILENNELGKWVHMVSVYATQTADHFSVVEKLWKALPMTKAEAIHMRADLVRLVSM